jgi:hypothetical protein
VNLAIKIAKGVIFKVVFGNESVIKTVDQVLEGHGQPLTLSLGWMRRDPF